MAFAGDAWLDMNGIRTDNVNLNGTHVTNATYWIDPPFLSSKVPPNVMIVLDNSGSMNDQAYASAYDPSQFVSKNYFGYFEPQKCFTYQASEWHIIGDADPVNGCMAFAGSASVTNPVALGSFLNWATTRRVEAAKKLLVGGKANPRSMTTGCCVKVTGEGSSGWSFSKNFDNTTNPGVILPFNGNYKYSVSGSNNNDNLTVSPLISGTNTTNLFPLGDISAPADWVVAGAPTAWQAVSEATADSATTITNKKSANVPALFDYDFTGTGSGVISSVEVIAVAKKSSKVTMRFQGILQVNGTNYASNYSNLSTSFSKYSFSWTLNPSTNLPWTWLDIKTGGVGALNAFGIQAYTLPNATDFPTITQVYLKITTTSPSGTYGITIDTGQTQISGIMDSLSSDARFGLAYYNNDNGGHVDTYIGFGISSSTLTSIGNMSPGTFTPLAETLYELVGYFRQDAPYLNNSPADYKIGAQYDPYYYQYSTLAGSGLLDQYVPCAKSFVLMLTDGEPTMDQNIPAWLQDYDNDADDPTPDSRYPSSGSDFLDDVALWARTVDHRSDLNGIQNIVIYPVFMFGKGSLLLQSAAINGGFEDLDGNNKPSCLGADGKVNPAATQDQLRECYRDSNGSGVIDPYDPVSNPDGDLPLTYFQGDDGYELQSSIIDAIAAIMKRAASGTSVSVLGSSWKGEGAMHQAYFYPEKVEGLRRIKWTGYFHSLFVDRNGLIHEDSNGDGKLTAADDKVVQFEFLPGSDTKVKYFWDVVNNVTGDPVPDGVPDTLTPIATVNITDLHPIYDAGKLLAKRDPADRTIFTVVGTDAASYLKYNFTDMNAAALRPFLRAKTSADAANLINFIRGAKITGWRDRDLTVDGVLQTWKLGDVVFSDPIVVGPPAENFDLIYGDTTYKDYWTHWQDRRNVIYVGSNDGMLHAFNAGFSVSSSEQNVTPTTMQVAFCEAYNAAKNGCAGDALNPLGKELWGFIPRDVLPHLAWLADPDYAHVYYVDQVPRVFDARVFAADADHVNGWGTMLIIGMRFGGGEMDVSDTFGAGPKINQFKSSWFAIDITNPDSPRFMWRFSDQDLGFTTSLPTIVKVGQIPGDSWFAVFGSGPSNFRAGRVVDLTITNTKFTKDGVVSTLPPGMTSTNPFLFAIDLKTGTALNSWTADASSSRKGVYKASYFSGFFSGPTNVDYPLDFSSDMIYAGSIYCSANCSLDGYGTWSGEMLRWKTNNSSDPGKWSASQLFNAAQPISAKPNAALDPRGNVWVYFGTGRFLHIDDRFDTTANYLYGIKDTCYYSGCGTSIANDAKILDSNTYVVQTDGSLLPQVPAGIFGAGSPTSSIGTFDDLKDYMASSGAGWKIALGPSERMTVNGFVVGGVAGFGTYIPNKDLCEFEGQSKQYAPSYLTGTAVYIPNATWSPTLSVTSGSGMPSAPAVHVDAHGNVRLFLQKSTGEVKILDMKMIQNITGGLGFGGETAD